MTEFHPRFHRLVELSGPLFAGEAEMCRSYFNAPARDPVGEKAWLVRQCFKEYWGSGFVDPERGILGEWLADVIKMLPKIDTEVDRHEALDLVEAACAEFRHYCLFADIYDSLRAPGEAKLNPRMLKNWPESEVLDKFRIDIRAQHGKLGRATLGFTEGGYCALYAEGAKIAGRGGVDDKIAAACRRVYDDEVGHMLHGIAAINHVVRSAADWDLVERLVIDQLRMRVHMRNGQFGHPVSAARIAEIFAGKIEPVRVDLEGLTREAA